MENEVLWTPPEAVTSDFSFHVGDPTVAHSHSSTNINPPIRPQTFDLLWLLIHRHVLKCKKIFSSGSTQVNEPQKGESENPRTEGGRASRCGPPTNKIIVTHTQRKAEIIGPFARSFTFFVD